MGYHLYDWLVDGFIVPLILSLNIVPKDQLTIPINDVPSGPIRSFIIDSLEMTTILLFLIINTILLIWLERKVSSGRAWMARGPVFIDFNYAHFFSWPFGKRTWKFGLLQNIAEFLKFFSKEDIVPEKADKFPFNIGFFAFVVAPPFILGALLPLGVNVIADPAVGFLLIFSLFSLYPVGVLVTGWSSNNKYSLLGGFRSAAQMISYEIPLMLSVTAVVLATHSFSLVDIAKQQTTTLGSLPFAILMPIGFIVFMASLAAETERIPFDIPEAEAELVMGWRTELTGFRYMMSMATEYFILLIGAFIGVFLFWGGAYLPFGNTSFPPIEALSVIFFVLVAILFFVVLSYIYLFRNTTNKTKRILGLIFMIVGIGIFVLGLIVSFQFFLGNFQGVPLNDQIDQIPLLAFIIVVIKLWTFIFLYIWIRASLPRVRIDQLLDIGWKRLIPLAILNIIYVVFVVLNFSQLFGVGQ